MNDSPQHRIFEKDEVRTLEEVQVFEIRGSRNRRRRQEHKGLRFTMKGSDKSDSESGYSEHGRSNS